MSDLIDTEAARIMTICNACRYCEGHCAVFPAMERSQQFDLARIEFLSNLCHQCGACLAHCQYAEPHEFNVNVPATFTQARQESYGKYLWPQLPNAFSNSTGAILGIAILVFALGIIQQVGTGGLFDTHASFYALLPHSIMAGTFLLVTGLVVMSIIMTCRNYWSALELPRPFAIKPSTWRRALASAIRLDNLGGGHDLGCYEKSEKPSLARRYFHHAVVIGFVLCFLATSAGTLLHYIWNAPAPYGWLTLPKLFGMTGGILLVFGCAGLLVNNRQTAEAYRVDDRGFSESLTWLLLGTAVTGLALPFCSGTPALGLVLAVHLGFVLALFVNFACGKFLHVFFRIIALLADAHEQQQE